MGRPTVGSLFSGIGGMDLGLERAGFRVLWQVEWDAWCQRVLAKHWPDVPRYGDITAVDWSGVERVDLLAGGFPCQPFSNAGRRRGKADDRWLWPSFAAAIGALRPRLILVENVPGLLAGHGGMGSVLGDLAALGYDAEWDCIPASAVGAPHLRYRVWIVAYPDGQRPRWPSSLGPSSFAGLRPQGAGAELDGSGDGAMADARCLGIQPERRPRKAPRATGEAQGEASQRERGRDALGDGRPDAGPMAYPDGLGWIGNGGLSDDGNTSFRDDLDGRGAALADTSSESKREPADAEDALPGGGDAWPLSGGGGWWDAEPNVGRVAHGVPSRVDRLRGLGNAVVPQVVEVIGRQLLAALENVA